MEEIDFKMHSTVFRFKHIADVMNQLPEEYFRKRAQGPDCHGTLWPEVIESQGFFHTTNTNLILHALTGGNPAMKEETLGLAQKIAKDLRSSEGKPGEGRHPGAVLIPIIPYNCGPDDGIELRVHKMGWKPKYISQKKSVNQPYLMRWMSDSALYPVMCEAVIKRGLAKAGKQAGDATALLLAQDALTAMNFGLLENGTANTKAAKVVIEGEWKALTVGQTNLEKAVKWIAHVASSPNPEVELRKLRENPPTWYVPVGTIGVNGIYENVGSNKHKKYALNKTFEVLGIDRTTPIILGPDGDIGTASGMKVAAVPEKRGQTLTVMGKPSVIGAMNSSANVLHKYSDDIRCLDLTHQAEKGFDDCIIDQGFDVGCQILDSSFPISSDILSFREIEQRLLDGEKGMDILRTGPTLQQAAPPIELGV